MTSSELTIFDPSCGSGGFLEVIGNALRSENIRSTFLNAKQQFKQFRLQLDSWFYSPTIDTANSALDKKIEEILENIVRVNPYIDRKVLANLEKLSSCLGNYLLQYSNEKYKENKTVTEKDCHEDLRRFLRSSYHLGDSVKNHPEANGGKLDLEYFDITIEIKIEKEKADREYLCNKYSAQTAQYSSKKGVGIVVIFDFTNKELSPAYICNEVHCKKVKGHGYSGEEIPTQLIFSS